MEGRPRCHYTLAAAEAQICIDSRDSDDLSRPASLAVQDNFAKLHSATTPSSAVHV